MGNAQRTHQPKGGMCATCEKCREDCSGLPFETMPVITETVLGVKIVRCAEHVRDNFSKPDLHKQSKS